MLKELMVTIRRLAKRPSFTLPTIATLAVGVGATTAIFSIVNATLLRPLPYPRSDDLWAKGGPCLALGGAFVLERYGETRCVP